MAKIKDYASLVQGILDWSHRANLAPYVDYFISNAQDEIEQDVPDLNFGNYIRAQESSYGPFTIANGVAPVPADWLGPKLLLVSDANGGLDLLIVKDPQWIYDAYPQRQATGPPSYVGRDIWQQTYAQPQTFTLTGGQTVVTLATAPTNSTLMLVSLDGASLTAGVSYTLSGTTLTLGSGAVAGQILSVQYLSTSSGIQTWTATASQTSFALSNPSLQVIAATLDGSILNVATDYTVAGGYITLTVGAVAGQILTAYLLTGSVLIFGPYPDAPYTVQGTYYARAPRLSSTATITTNWMTAYCPDVLLNASMREVAKFLKDAQMFQLWDGDYSKKLKAFVDKDKAERWGAATMQVETG